MQELDDLGQRLRGAFLLPKVVSDAALGTYLTFTEAHGTGFAYRAWYLVSAGPRHEFGKNRDG